MLELCLSYRARGAARGHPVPNALLCLAALQGPRLPQEQEPAGASPGAPARLPPADIPVPEHPQVRAGRDQPCLGHSGDIVGAGRGLGVGLERCVSEGSARITFLRSPLTHSQVKTALLQAGLRHPGPSCLPEGMPGWNGGTWCGGPAV